MAKRAKILAEQFNIWRKMEIHFSPNKCLKENDHTHTYIVCIFWQNIEIFNGSNFNRK